ncbi:hypothetical protein [Labilibaculum euxinus]
MKKTILLSIAVLMTLPVLAQTQVGGTNSPIYHLNNKVGIGINKPDNYLDVSGDIEGTSFNVRKTSYTQMQFATYDWSGSHAILFNSYKEITKNGPIYMNSKFSNDMGSYSSGAGAIMFMGNGGTMNFYISPRSTGKGDDVEWGIPKMQILRSGNVGIGTTSPDYKLDVEGTIRARELKVDMEGADFVFEKGYNLLSLTEVDEFITTNKHLPDVTPAKEMQENGVNQSEMNQLLLRKIEELTLYTIEQSKRLSEKDEKVSELERRLAKLEQLLTNL